MPIIIFTCTQTSKSISFPLRGLTHIHMMWFAETYQWLMGRLKPNKTCEPTNQASRAKLKNRPLIHPYLEMSNL